MTTLHFLLFTSLTSTTYQPINQMNIYTNNLDAEYLASSQTVNKEANLYDLDKDSIKKIIDCHENQVHLLKFSKKI